MTVQQSDLAPSPQQVEFKRQVHWLESLITDPAGTRYLQTDSSEARRQEFQEQLARAADFLNFAGNPQAKYPSIHVAGTSGKGSVVTMLAALLKHCQLHTGSHVSPYLQVSNEKLQIDGQLINLPEFIALVERFKQLHTDWAAAGRPFTALRYNEAWTALAFLWFAQREVDWAIVETGVGGRFDPTNTLPACLAVITNVDFDHTEVLGQTLPEIAYHKAGIIKSQQAALTAATDQSVLRVIREEAAKQKAQLYCLGPDFDFDVHHLDHAGAHLSIRTPFHHYANLRLSLSGAFQPVNAALAVAAADVLRERYGLPLTLETIQAALANVKFPGRMEIVQARPLVMLDGAHNPHKLQALANSLRILYPNKRVTAIIGMLMTKDAHAGMQVLLPALSRVVTVQPHVPGKPALAASALADVIREMKPALPCDVAGSVREGIDLILPQLDADDLLLITGSLYILGEARDYWIPTARILQDLES